MNPPRTITVKFFAILREQAGCREVTVETAAATPAMLYQELMAVYGLTVPLTILSFAINGRYVPGDTVLNAGDQVVFIPPVAGG